MENKSFTPLNFGSGRLFDYSFNKFPTRLYAWDSDLADNLQIEQRGSTFYGFVFQGTVSLSVSGLRFPLMTGMYFSFAEMGSICGGRGILVERVGFKGLFTLGGPIEDVGRLKYIDGCTDSLLVPPIRLGDPCLNALYFPPKVDQTAHTHPSMRIGIVFKGEGECITPIENVPLFPGQIFIIHEGGLHSFRTPKESGMVVIAYHPDSDYGPEDENHPMINRTMVDGKSASGIDAIRTKE